MSALRQFCNVIKSEKAWIETKKNRYLRKTILKLYLSVYKAFFMVE